VTQGLDQPKRIRKVTGVLTFPCFIETSPDWRESSIVSFPAGSRITISEENFPHFVLQQDLDKATECLSAHPDVRALFRRG
jgi:hypothetical protein